MMGGHIVKTGVAPVLIDLMERGVITHLASNGSAIIHDYEMARWGGTSEDVEAGLADGTFGMAEETGREMNEAITRGAAEGWGLGEAVGRALESRDDLAHPERSLLLAARRLGVPFTVHAAIGAEIIHQHPAADGAAIGATSHPDFRRLAARLTALEGGRRAEPGLGRDHAGGLPQGAHGLPEPPRRPAAGIHGGGPRHDPALPAAA